MNTVDVSSHGQRLGSIVVADTLGQRARLISVLISVCLAVALALCLPSARANGASALDQTTDGPVFSLSYRSDLYVVEDGVARAISYEEWELMGFPSPVLAPTRFVKYSWSPSIYALTPWSDSEETWQLDVLNPAQWRRAGYPTPDRVVWVPGSYLYKWATAPSIGIEDPAGDLHWLTWSEWSAMGFRAFDDRDNEGFVKLTWDPSIARMEDLASWKGRSISWLEWRDANFPTPRAYARFPGDQFTRYYGDPTIYYSGLTATRAITYSEWSAAGFPTPTVLYRDVDCTRVSCVALTFDDGPSPYTDRLIGSLKKLEVPATFFVVGEQVTLRPSVTRNLQAAGLSVQNHSFTHPRLDYLSYAAQLSEVQRTDDALSALGVNRSGSLRPPYGAWNADTRRLGKPLILWSVDPRDWDGKSASSIRNHVATYTRAGDIVLMHDRVSATVDAVPGIVSDLRAKGFTLVSVDTLIPNLQPGDIAYSRTNVVRSSTSPGFEPQTRDGGPVVDGAPGPYAADRD